MAEPKRAIITITDDPDQGRTNLRVQFEPGTLQDDAYSHHLAVRLLEHAAKITNGEWEGDDDA